jgi:uncharacterized membrane protein
MSRALFLSQLRLGLRGLSPGEIDEICADYESHFADAVESGRSETEIAAALGNPVQLAREWRAESGLRNWETKSSPGNFLRASWALIALMAFDVVILLPLVLGLLFGAGVALYVFYLLGRTGFGLMTGLFFGDGMIAPGLAGLGMLCGAISAAALIALLLGLGLRLLGRYARLHYRLARPGDGGE